MDNPEPLADFAIRGLRRTPDIGGFLEVEICADRARVTEGLLEEYLRGTTRRLTTPPIVGDRRKATNKRHLL